MLINVAIILVFCFAVYWFGHAVGYAIGLVYKELVHADE